MFSVVHTVLGRNERESLETGLSWGTFCGPDPQLFLRVSVMAQSFLCDVPNSSGSSSSVSGPPQERG